MKGHDPLRGSIVSCLSYFINNVDKGFMLQDGDKISTQENLLNSTILDHLLLLSSSIVKGRVALAEEPLDNYYINYMKLKLKWKLRAGLVSQCITMSQDIVISNICVVKLVSS